MTNRNGQQLGNYRLIRLLGRGGFAEVYLGEHIFLKTHSAIKILHTQVLQKDMENFLTEARTVANLRNANIVRVQDFGIENTTGTLFLVMDYAPHGSLRQLHPAGTTVPLSTIVSYVKQVAAALQHAHDAKLIHRDVKPENMLLGYHNEVILSDFGLVAMAHSTTSLKTQSDAGTIYYMAPEQINGKPRPASDQYALGITVYEWLSGSRPFEGDLAIQIALKHLTEAPPPLQDKIPTLAPEVEQVVMKAMAKDPQRRFSSVREFALALEEAYKQQEARTKKQMSETKTKEQWFAEGYAHGDAKRYKEAIEAYSRAIELDPCYAPAYTNRGFVYNNLNQYEQAIADYTRAIALNPNDALIYNNRGYAYTELKEYQKAIADCDHAISLNPQLPYTYDTRGYTFYHLRQYQRAIDDFDRAIALAPDLAVAYYNRGNTYAALKQYQRAIQDYDRALALGFDDVNAYRNRGLVYYFLNEHQKAITDYDHAIALAPSDATTYLNRALAYHFLNEHQKAIADYTHAIAFNPNYAAAYNGRGYSLIYLKQYHKAISDSNRALELNPKDANTYDTRGYAYYHLKQYQQAIADFDHALALDPNLADTYYHRGDTYTRLKQYQRAIQDYDHALALDADLAAARANREEAYRLLGGKS